MFSFVFTETKYCAARLVVPPRKGIFPALERLAHIYLNLRRLQSPEIPLPTITVPVWIGSLTHKR